MSSVDYLEETDPGDEPAKAGSFTPPGGVHYQANDLIDAICSRVRAEMHNELEGQGGGGGGAGGGPPPHGNIDIKKFRNGNWVVQIIVGLVIAGAGAFAAYKATEERSVGNQEAIKGHEALPMHKEAGARIEKIEREVTGTMQTVQIIEDQVRVIAGGIDQLKAEAQTDKQKRLEEKLKALERENRRLNGGN